jgi:hypothetical protein
MKRISLYTTIIAFAMTSSLSSCLKDDSQPDFTKNQAVIEIPIGSSTGNGGGNSINASFTIDPVPSDYFIYVNYAAPEANPTDVTVTMSVDTAAVTKFNSVNGTDYAQMPANGYTLSSNKITIPAGQRKVKFPVKINTINLDPTKTYAMPLTIVDGGGFTVSGNFGKLISIITLKNKWDGVYTVTGSMIDQVNSSLTGVYPRTFQLITQSVNSVAVFDPGANGGSYAHGINNAGSASYYGDFSPVFSIDATTNDLTAAVNYYGQPASNGRAARLDVTGVNKFTMSADGKTPVSLKVKYVLVQGGSDRTFFDETWTYTSAR